MTPNIIHNLSLLEKERKIKILYAVESGSRAWGFSSINSDYDVRFLYVNNLDYYFSISNNLKDTIEKMINENDLDFSGWELKKSLRLFAKSNPCLLEWLDSPIIYSQDDTFINKLRSLREKFFDPKSSIYHYLHMARNNFDLFLQKDSVKLKKYFYVLRPVLCCSWIFRTKTHAPMLFDTLLQNELHDTEIKDKVNDLLVRKKSGAELDEGDRIHCLNEYLREKIDLYSRIVKDLPVKTIPQDDVTLNTFCKETILRSVDKPVSCSKIDSYYCGMLRSC
jgi:hypothetical protein